VVESEKRDCCVENTIATFAHNPICDVSGGSKIHLAAHVLKTSLLICNKSASLLPHFMTVLFRIQVTALQQAIVQDRVLSKCSMYSRFGAQCT